VKVTAYNKNKKHLKSVVPLKNVKITITKPKKVVQNAHVQKICTKMADLVKNPDETLDKMLIILKFDVTL
jgi:hypothetical protein